MGRTLTGTPCKPDSYWVNPNSIFHFGSDKKGRSNNFSTQSGLKQPGATGLQIPVFTGLNRAFAIVMNDEGTLFSLFRTMLADIDKGLYNVVKGIYVVVKEHDLVKLLLLLIHEQGFLQAFFTTHLQWLCYEYNNFFGCQTGCRLRNFHTKKSSHPAVLFPEITVIKSVGNCDTPEFRQVLGKITT